MVMSFKVEAIDQVLGEAVVELGYTFLKQEQKQAILAFLQGREVLWCSQQNMERACVVRACLSLLIDCWEELRLLLSHF